MRVIAGTARGRRLRASPATRPTADLIKGVIFSMLEALAYKRGYEPDEEGTFAAALAWPRVLDLFAGSGALGIEALSRGAQHADFVEQDRAAARIIEENLRATGLAERAHVHLGLAQASLLRVRGPIDAVFADPPYREAAELLEVVDRLGASGLVSPSGVVVLEQSAAAEPPPEVGPLPLHHSRTHGRTRVALYAATAQ